MSNRQDHELHEDHRPPHVSPTVIRLRQRPLALTLGAVGVTLFLIDVLLQSIDAVIETDSEAWFQFVRLLDLNAESSLPTWFAVVQLFAGSLIALSIAFGRSRAGDKYARQWFLLAILVAGFSLDEAAQIHDAPSREPLRDMLGTSGLLRYPWVVAAVLSAVILTAVMFRFLRSLPLSTRMLLIVSAATFGAGAIGMEMVTGWYADSFPDGDYGYQMLTSVEELLEMAGGTILVYGLLGYARDSIGNLRIVWEDESPSDEGNE